MSTTLNTATQPPEPGRYRPKNRGMAAHIATIANATYDPLAADALRAVVPQIARMERALDELVADAFEEAAIEGAIQ